MRLTIVVDSRVYGGAEKYIVQLANRLPADMNVTLVLVTPALRELLETPDATVLALRPRGWRDAQRQLQLFSAVARTQPDLVHLNLPEPARLAGLMAVATRKRAPVVATVHTWQPLLRRHSIVLRLSYPRLALCIGDSREIVDRVTGDLGVRKARGIA